MSTYLEARNKLDDALNFIHPSSPEAKKIKSAIRGLDIAELREAEAEFVSASSGMAEAIAELKAVVAALNPNRAPDVLSRVNGALADITPLADNMSRLVKGQPAAVIDSGQGGSGATSAGPAPSAGGEKVVSPTPAAAPADEKPATPPPAPAAVTNEPEIGKLSERYESGGDAGAVGEDSKGGPSYGKYQIATKTGTMKKFLSFLAKTNPGLAQKLEAGGGNQGALKRKSTFLKAWKELARVSSRELPGRP